MLLAFDDVIASMEANIKLSPIVTELFLREENSTFHLFLCHNIISKCLKLKDKTQHIFFIMKIPYKRELQQTLSNHSSDIEF